jgi:TolA protein
MPSTVDRAKAEEEALKAKEKKAAAERLLKEKQRLAEQEKALKRIQEDAAREAALKNLSAKQGKSGRQKLAGNILSKGTATTGAIGNAKDRYTGLVHEAIKEHFNIFPWQRKKNLSALVRLDIFPNGRVRARRIIRKSADPLYDSAVLKAIDSAQPLPIPDDIAIISDGLVVEFKPE